MSRAMDVGVEGKAEFDPRELLRATIDALGTMDVVALEALSAEAEKIATMRIQMKHADVKEAISLKGALGELLRSTERSLRMLRGLREAGLRQIEEGSVWAR
jgi:hypothetical protein